MKYARTNDGIFEISDILIDGRIKVYMFHNPNLRRFTRIYEAKDVIGQADALKDLCDVLVIEEQNIYDNGIHKYLMEQPFVFEKDGDFSKTLSTKGAIWTSKGLIYVAEMNDKGELCLL